MPKEAKPWGRIAVGVRLGKLVEAEFVSCLTGLMLGGLRAGDTVIEERGKPAHEAANGLIRQFLKTECDTLLFLDDDAEFDMQFLNVLRDFKAGWEYDGLQAFYTRRGWPPEAIWMKRDPASGLMMQCIVMAEGTEDVDMIGTHTALFRREVFVAIYEAYGKPDGIPLDEFQWFSYPRHRKVSDEATLSEDAKRLGFRLGATTQVKMGHISRVSTGWQTYQEYLRLSGQNEELMRRQKLALLASEYLAEQPAFVLSQSYLAKQNLKHAWEKCRPGTVREAREFYQEFGRLYIYELVRWNSTELYQAITEPLRAEAGEYALVIGAGIGGEVECLIDHNTVSVYELPGELRKFVQWRFAEENYNLLFSPCLLEELNHTPTHAYSLVVAVDVLEHIHPDEFGETMAEIARIIMPDGRLYCHNAWGVGQYSDWPMHYDHSSAFSLWCERFGFVKESEYVYRKVEGHATVSMQRLELSVTG